MLEVYFSAWRACRCGRKLGWLLIDDLDVDDGVKSEPAGTYVGDSLGRETGAAIGERIGPSVVGMKRNRPREEWAA